MTTDKNIFETNAPLYWDKNLTVTPIPLGTKRGIQSWQNFIDQVPSAVRQKEWFEKYGDHGIGLLTGKDVLNGLKMIAIDVDDDRYVDAIVRIFGPIVSAKKGQKGITLFVLSEPEVKHTTINLGKKRIIDVLVRKCCVLPPTIHPGTGQPYEWEGKPLHECEADDFRVVTKQEIDLLKAVIEDPDHEAFLVGEATHDPALRLTARIAVRFDVDMIIHFLTSFLPESYKGNIRDELPEMIRSAQAKGLGKRGILVYEPREIGPIPMGYTDNGNYVFLHQVKNVLSVFGPGNLMSVPGLCDLAPFEFWLDLCPKFNKDGKPINQIDHQQLGDLLMEACRGVGPFIASRVRGCGIWREGEAIIQNLRGSLPQGKNTYIRFKSLPDFETEERIEPKKLQEWFQLFNWTDPSYTNLLLGWTALAPICGALGWRTHMFIHGPKNTGKTTLIRVLSSILEPMAVTLDGTSSEAGIRQSIGADSRPVILDEFESDGNTNRMRSILKLARSASSGAAPIARGTPEGKALQFQVHSSFLFGAIIPIPGTAADASRIVEVELAKHDSNRDTKQKIDDGITYLLNRRSSWCHQMIALIEPITDSIKVFERLMPPGDSRHSLNMANLLGASYVVLKDKTATPEEAQPWIDKHEAMITSLALVHEEDDSYDCLNHLLCYPVKPDELGEVTLGKLLRDACSVPRFAKGTTDETMLTRHGIKPIHQGFLIANKHRGLNKVFQGTLWENGAWKTALKRLPGAKSGDEYRTRFSGGQAVRCVFLPEEAVLNSDEE